MRVGSMAMVWFRAAAVLLLLFAAGHTFGFLTFRPSSAEGRGVWDAMNNVHFTQGKVTASYGGFYVGFGLFITAFQLFAAWLAWRLGEMARRGVADALVIGTGMLVLQLVSTGLSWRYFSVGPAMLSILAAGCLGMGLFAMGGVVRVQA